jgi:pyruvate dehydrogenase E2 component (dihydrolipoamide acetyltransferase)
MPINVTMPRLSDTMQAGTIVRWAVKEGQKVKTGDVLGDIETDKATMELTSFDDGTVAQLAVKEGQQVPVGTLIIVLAGAGEDAASVKAQGAGASAGSASASPAASSTRPSQAAASGGAGAASSNYAGGSGTAVLDAPLGGHDTAGGNGRIFASPLARKIAAESGVSLTDVKGSGPSGRIIRKDVEAAIAAPPTPPTPSSATSLAPRSAAADVAAANQASRTRAIATAAPLVPAMGSRLQAQLVPLSNMRRTIARRLVESKTQIPHYQVTVEVDMDALVALRSQLNEQLGAQGVKLSVNDFLVRACALAMHQHPFVNSRWVPTPNNESVEILPDVNIGVAIALDESRGGGLVVATIRHADQIGLRQISAQTKALSDKARTKGLTIEEMSDATFTISNLGMFGVDRFTAIINPPNVAILAVGAAVQKPVVKDGQLAAGWVMTMTMSSDHRVVDGAMAAAYLNSVKGLLEKPATLLV